MNDINFTMYKLAGIIAEYDPFHNGHAWQLQQAKALGAQRVAVAMSCGLTQRGALPLLPESVRVQAALTCGADLVFALPAPYACSGAECFARAGVQLLAAAGCDALVFGAETPDAALLMEAARVLSGAEYRNCPQGPACRRGPQLCGSPAGSGGSSLPGHRPCRPAGQAQQQSGRGILQGHLWSWGLLWCRSPCPGRVPVTGRP
ncbi:MAG: nucleotidyltransferase family protein [Faecalibacterium sp.]